MKRVLAVVLALMLVVMSSAALAESKTIAGVVFQEDQFMKMLSDGYAAAAKDLGYEILLANTNNDQSKESEIVNTYVSQGIAGVAISPLNSDTSPAVLEELHLRLQEQHLMRTITGLRARLDEGEHTEADERHLFHLQRLLQTVRSSLINLDPEGGTP